MKLSLYLPSYPNKVHQRKTKLKYNVMSEIVKNTKRPQIPLRVSLDHIALWCLEQLQEDSVTSDCLS